MNKNTSKINNWISIDIDKLRSRVQYSEDSPSGLVWAEDHGNKLRPRIYKKGSQAGTKAKVEYRIRLFGEAHSCSRIVYHLHNPNEDLDGYFIHNIDWNKFNNRIENLAKVSVSEFRRLVINKYRGENNLEPSQFLDKVSRGKKYREENAEHISTTLKKYHERHRDTTYQNSFADKYTNKERKMWQSAKERSKKFNLDFSIEISDIIIPQLCPILGIPLFGGEGRVHPNSPSLDRKIPELGYTKDNIWVISHKANSIKTNATKDELLAFSLWVMENYDDL